MFLEKRPYQGASGRVYPLPFVDQISDVIQDRSYQVACLENEYLLVRVLPEIGGKIQQAYDKVNQYDFIYHNTVIKPAMIGLTGPWVSGGIEFNWPQHHRPTTFMPLESCIETGLNGEKTVWVGEVEPMHRMKGMAGITVCPGRSYVKVKVRLYNRTALPHPVMWWANLAVSVNPDYQIVFPPDVAWVNDHDRRAVIDWPIARGVYRTARPFDYGDGTDLSRYPNVVVPTSFMVSQGQSEMDFVSGYDHSRNCGVVTVADHAIAPGKKLFHWGNHDFGANWCCNLTDTDGPYVELMTGVYSDNQPDFTWIHPDETKCFEMYWYPISGIGAVKNATPDAAINLEADGENLKFGLQVTGVFPACRIEIKSGPVSIFTDQADLAPDQPYIRQIGWPAERYRVDHLSASLFSADGRELVSYRIVGSGKRAPIVPRRPAARPAEIESIEELYLNGLHLEQYKHHTFVPEDYHLEALRRDPGDSRCNAAMGRIRLKQGCFAEAAAYLEQAIARLTVRNGHPDVVEPFYLLGVCRTYLGQDQAAEAAYQRCIWQYSHRSAGYYALATLDARRGDYLAALSKLELSLRTNTDSLKVRCLKAALLRNLGRTGEALAVAEALSDEDPLDFWVAVENAFAQIQSGASASAAKQLQTIRTRYFAKPESYLDAVNDYLASGLACDALALLELADPDYPLVQYYSAAVHASLGDTEKAVACIERSSQSDDRTCFPARLEDLAVLQTAARICPQDDRAPYYLGCLLYDRSRNDEAIAAWQLSVALNPDCAAAHRNLALALHDKRGDKAAALDHLLTARRLAPDQPRLLYELQQLHKSLNTPPAERLGIYEQSDDLVRRRDDCVLDQIVLLTQLGQHDQAIALTGQHRFHIYEGGEGQLTRHHAWLYTLLSWNQLGSGAVDLAEQSLKQAFLLPENYGEGKSYFAQENHVWFTRGLLFARTGRTDDSLAAWRQAADDKDSVSEINLFRALALAKLGRSDDAQAVLQAMITTGEQWLADCDVWPYFGVGAPTPMPFDGDIIKTKTIAGSLLKGFGLLGQGRLDEAEQAVAEARRRSPYHYQLFLFDQTAAFLASHRCYSKPLIGQED
jgi:tetratricopeptide (TPR) repeat protein